MTNKQLATIFAQFLYNITLDDLKRILTANESTIYAQMNLPLSEQLQADRFLKETIEQALSDGSSEDIKRLSGVIIQAVNYRERDEQMEFEIFITNKYDPQESHYFQYASIGDAQKHVRNELIHKYPYELFVYSGMALGSGQKYFLLATKTDNYYFMKAN